MTGYTCDLGDKCSCAVTDRNLRCPNWRKETVDEREAHRNAILNNPDIPQMIKHVMIRFWERCEELEQIRARKNGNAAR